MKLLVVLGGVDCDRDTVVAALKRAPFPDCLLHGATTNRAGQAVGADRWADEWARNLGVQVMRMPVPRAAGRGAPHRRNTLLLEFAASLSRAGNDVVVVPFDDAPFAKILDANLPVALPDDLRNGQTWAQEAT